MPHQPIPPKQPPGEPAEELLAILAHELRRPLTALLGAVATVHHRQQTLSVLQQQELLGMARRQGEQLGRLLGQLLAAAGVDRGHARLARRSLVDAAALAEEAGLAARLAHPDHRITIEVAGPLLVRVDPLAIAGILGNLLDNAAAYSPQQAGIWLSASGTACTRCWPSGIRGLGSHRLIATGSSSGMRGSTSRRDSTRPGLGLACTSPGAWPTPTTATSTSPTRQRLGGLDSSCGCP
jgi:light-regulated signal transduction histidine kinase (bacteriophytochrome)